MQLYEKVTSPSGRVTYREYVEPEQEPVVFDLTDQQAITAAGALGVTLLCLFERHVPPHKRIARKIKAVENAILDLFHGTGQALDTGIAEHLCKCWDATMRAAENAPEA